MKDIADEFGGIDIYLFDQLQKGRITDKMKILDVGCGNGRNLIYFMKQGCDVYGIDNSKTFINNVRFLAKQIGQKTTDDHFRLESMDKISFDNNFFDFIIASAVLHFAENDDQFCKWFKEIWRVLNINGILFIRLASTIGIEDKIEQLEGRRYHLPDGSDRYLVDEDYIAKITKNIGGELIEPIKSTNVSNMRSMTTWVMRKLSDYEGKGLEDLEESQGIKLFRE